MSKIIATLYENDDFKVEGEVVDNLFYLHVSVDNYNKSVRRKLKSVWKDIQEEVWLNGWDHIFSYNTNERFAKLFGWKVVDKDLGVYVWELG